MCSNFVQLTILKPARITSYKRRSLIDNISTNLCNKNINNGNLLNKISDHLPNFVIINDDFNKKKTQSVEIGDMKSFNENLCKTDLKEIQNTDLTNCQNIIEMYSLFQIQILNVINRYAPFRKLFKMENKLKMKPWITKGILQSIRKKKDFLNKYIKKQDPFWYERYRYYKNKVNKLENTFRKTTTTPKLK